MVGRRPFCTTPTAACRGVISEYGTRAVSISCRARRTCQRALRGDRHLLGVLCACAVCMIRCASPDEGWLQFSMGNVDCGAVSADWLAGPAVHTQRRMPKLKTSALSLYGACSMTSGDIHLSHIRY